jgi:hypothetical protein
VLATTESETRKIDVRFWGWISGAGKNGLAGLAKFLAYPDKRDNLKYYRELSKLAYRGQLPV